MPILPGEEAEKRRHDVDLRAQERDQDYAGRWWFPSAGAHTAHDRLMGVLERWDHKHAQDPQFSDEDHYEGREMPRAVVDLARRKIHRQVRKTRGGARPKENSRTKWNVAASDNAWGPNSADFEDLTKT